MRTIPLALLLALAAPTLAADEKKPTFNVDIPHVSTDPSIKLDYDIVYVRAGRAGDKTHKRYYTDFSQPVTMEGGADLMLLHPDGKEELLVEGGEGAITDPMISFDGQWCFYVHLYNLKNRNQWTPPSQGADIFKIHLKSRKIVRLTNQVFTPNLGAGDWTSDFRSQKDSKKNHFSYGVFNMGPCPLPGGKIVFTSNRDGFRPSKGYPVVALQLFVMDDRDESIDEKTPRPQNLEKIGHLNIAGALHPVILRDGRIIFSSLESQGVRSEISWGIWAINPDGTMWNPIISAFDPGGAANGFHFQTQLSDGSIVIEGYYNQNNSGFGSYVKLPEKQPYPAFGPATMRSTADVKPIGWHFGYNDNGKPRFYRMPFMPAGSEGLTPFAHIHDGPADRSIPGDKNSPALGKVTHPSGAPDNHLLTIYSPGPANHQYTYLPQLDGGIYLIKDGKAVDEPSQMRLIKNDPNYNESWPRAVVPYKRIYGVNEPARLTALKNDGKLSPSLPEGTPFALIGSSSFYKRESFPEGIVPKGSVTAISSGAKEVWRGIDAFSSHGNGMPINWHNQGAEAGLYMNDDIHAVRILVMEPTTDRNRGDRSGRRFHNHAHERLRILGEIPLRKFSGVGPSGPTEPLDPDKNPDTSFLAKIPADTAFTFQTLDKRGHVLHMAQTWHQLRAGEVRTDCGGCHAHSQEPTDFKLTAAAKPDYPIWDLTRKTPLITAKNNDTSKQRWDAKDETGLIVKDYAVVDIEYFKHIQPIFAKSCIACHTKDAKEPAGNLVLDADDQWEQVDHHGKFPGTYTRLAMDERAKFGHKPPTYDSWGYPNASRYIRKLQARRSLLTWKIHGERLDGFTNDDHPSQPADDPGAKYLTHKGERYDKRRDWHDLDFTGSQMPPRAAVEGTYKNAEGKTIKVEPLTDEDRRTIARWIDLGCPIDLDRALFFDKTNPRPESGFSQNFGWWCDDNRPVLAVTHPQAGDHESFSRILIGVYDYFTGLDEKSLTITATFDINGVKPGENLASKFTRLSDGVLELKLAQPITSLAKGTITVSIKDKAGNQSVIERTFSVTAKTVQR